MMLKLFKGCGSHKKKMVRLVAMHNDAYLCDQYPQVFHNFFTAVLSTPTTME
jgi:hypothetical protein